MMSICPICGAPTSDPCGTGGMGTGLLPESIKALNRDEYDVYAIEHNSGDQVTHTYSVQRKHITCDVCSALQHITAHDPDRARKIVRHVEVAVAIEKAVKEHGDVWEQLADM